MSVKHFEDVNKRVNVNYWLPSTTVTACEKKTTGKFLLLSRHKHESLACFYEFQENF